MSTQSPAAAVLLVVLVLIAAAIDLRSRRIPNWLTFSGIVAGVAWNGGRNGWAGLQSALGGMLLAFGCYFALYCLRAMGAGDVKLMAAIGAFIGPQNWLQVFIATALAGGILAIGMMIWTGRAKQTLCNTCFIVGELIHFRAPFVRRSDLDVRHARALNMPHGVAIAAGTFACLWLGRI